MGLLTIPVLSWKRMKIFFAVRAVLFFHFPMFELFCLLSVFFSVVECQYSSFVCCSVVFLLTAIKLPLIYPSKSESNFVAI